MAAPRGGIVGFVWLTPPSAEMTPDVERRRQQIPPTLGAALVDEAEAIQNDMRTNHPWRNRTGDAEGGLTAEWIDEGNTQVIAAYHTVGYGIFLELGTVNMDPRPIVGPTLEQHYASVRAIMDDIVGSN